MYMSEDFLDMAMGNLKEEWKSKYHKQVAQNTLLFNSNVFTMDRLMEGCHKINAIPMDQIQLITLLDLVKLGVPGFGT